MLGNTRCIRDCRLGAIGIARRVGRSGCRHAGCYGGHRLGNEFYDRACAHCGRENGQYFLGHDRLPRSDIFSHRGKRLQCRFGAKIASRVRTTGFDAMFANAR